MLALRGDPPKDAEGFDHPADGFDHAELGASLARRFEISPARAERLVLTYGSSAEDLLVDHLVRQLGYSEVSE